MTSNSCPAGVLPSQNLHAFLEKKLLPVLPACGAFVVSPYWLYSTPLLRSFAELYLSIPHELSAIAHDARLEAPQACTLPSGPSGQEPVAYSR